MHNRDQENSKSADQALDRLIRESRRSDDQSIDRPSDEAISAYINGEADTDQRSRVMQAMIDSADFRREIHELGRDLDFLATGEASEKFDQLVARHSSRQTDFEAADSGGTGASRRSTLAAIRDRVTRRDDIGWLWKAAMPVAAVIVLLLVGPQVLKLVGIGDNLGPVASWQEVGAMDPGQFVNNVTRSPSAGNAPEVFATSRLAAEAEFRQAISFEDNRFVIATPDSARRLPPPGDTLVVLLMGGDNVPLAAVKTVIPIASVEAGMLWSITPSQRILRQAEVTSDTVRVNWPDDYGRDGCLSVTYPVDSGFAASPWVDFRY